MTGHTSDGNYELAMPFVVCQSQGGPYEDTAFTAGWICAAIDAQLAAGGRVRGEYVTEATLPQIDLIAMSHGCTVVKRGLDDGWLFVDIDRPQ